MKGIILAAGRGTRLDGAGRPKCLLRFGGITLLERQIRELRAAGVADVVVVAGHEAERVRRRCRGAELVMNPDFDRSGSLHSLWLARGHLAEGCVVLNGDVLFHPRLLRRLLAAPDEDALLVAYRGDAATTLGDEEMKVRVRDGRVVDISKTIPPDEADGENVGMAKFGRDGAGVLAACVDALIRDGHGADWAPRAFRAFAGLRPLRAIGTGPHPWIEIDFPEDYRRALDDVAPRIFAAERGRVRSVPKSEADEVLGGNPHA